MTEDLHDLEPEAEVVLTKRELDDLVYACMSVMAVASAVSTKRWPKWGFRFFAGLGALSLADRALRRER